MKLELSNTEAKNLLRMLSVADSMVGYLNDHIADSQIATKARVWTKLNDKISELAYEQGLTDIITKDERSYHLSEEEYDSLMELALEYDDFVLHKGLARTLAERDFDKNEPGLQKDELSQDYVIDHIRKIHQYEEVYWNEFEKHGYERIYINPHKSRPSLEEILKDVTPELLRE